MNIAEKIVKSINKLPESKQVEILDFVEYLEQKNVQNIKLSDSELSLSLAMNGLENEDAPYTQDDLKEVFND